MNSQLMKTHIPKSQQNLEIIENLQKTVAVPSFQNGGQHYFSIKEIKPESQMPSLFNMKVTISFPKQIISKKFDQFSEFYKEGTYIFVEQKNSAELLKEYVLYHRGKTIIGSFQNDATTGSFIFNTIKQKQEKNNNRFVYQLQENVRNDDIFYCGRYISIRQISNTIAQQTVVPYFMPVSFTISIPLDDLLIFSAFSEYPDSPFDLIISMAKYCTINKDELLRQDKDQLKEIDHFFRNWYLTFKYTNMFTQIGCSTDLITGICAEKLTLSVLKYLVCDIKPVIVSVRNNIVRALTANMSGYKASVAYLNRERNFYASCPFVVPALRIETLAFSSCAALIGIKTTYNIPLSHVTEMSLLFLKGSRCITCFENPCYQNLQVSTLGRNFSDFLMNTLNEQFFTMQLAANSLDNIFETADKYEDSFATPRRSTTRKFNPVSDNISFFVTLQRECNSNGSLIFDGLDTQNQNTQIELRGQPIFQSEFDTYYNVDTNGKHPSPPILCTIHDTFWPFTPLIGGSCDYDTTHSFDEVIGQITA
ncbi:MAG: hypothetical protein EZS28_026385 [Streblomastix strix]|uniref:Uncharacterized protein n=1 Tax=Streblomastix strix TaxID=222440 RepID=A0A5J4V5T7_9EUKA|nr:MAG: hypothetical protein EZS28_026385 [Streblomastix strix]